tara:strand:+ start:6924 stop:8201 length:1278 start_codon:yes stop_codon:yes gene_type:complete
MAIANQGYRRDLNLSETTNDTVALDNLAGAGTADDISYIQNNLRNTSSIGFNKIDADGFFSFATDRNIAIDSIKSVADVDANNNPINSSSITVNLTNPYLIKFGDLINISGIVDGTTGSPAENLNGQHSVISVSPNLKEVSFKISGIRYSNDSIADSAITFTLKVQKIFVFTDGDIINVNGNVTIGGVSFTENTNYYVVESDGVSKFKLSTTSGGSAISIAGGATATPDNFQFVRQDAVRQQQLVNYIQPQVQDTTHFGYQDSVNSTLESTQTNIESAEFFSLKKYRGDKNLTTPDPVKYEGSIVLNDPGNYNNDSNKVLNQGVTGAPAPGIYIGDTRAFSSDNNPWVKSSDTGNTNGKLTTESEEVSIGELAFLDGGASMVITGIENDISTVDVTANSFTHKIPVKVQDANGNQESYFLLLTEN